MKANARNIRIAYAIAEILEEEKCTVDETREILSFISSISGKNSTVQMKGIISELSEESRRADPAGIH